MRNRIIRWVGTAVLLVGIWSETGLWTTAFALSVVVQIEVRDRWANGIMEILQLLGYMDESKSGKEVE